MADDEEKAKTSSLQSLFLLYCNHVVIPLDVDNEVYESILLSQIDMWIDQAKVLRSHFSLTATGMTYMKFRKWRLDFKEFQQYLEMLCAGKEITINDVTTALLEAGAPGGTTEVVMVK